MKIGLSAGGTLERMCEQGREAEADGFASLWFAGTIGMDPLAVIAVVGQATSAVELGTSIVQTYPRHPVAMAQSAAVARASCGERFTLGLGVSHRPAIEGYGYSYDRPAQHLREYLATLDRAFEQMKSRPPVLIAALGPVMLAVAKELAGGTITWMANRKAVETHVAPRLGDGQRIVVGLPVAVCDDADAGREVAARQFAGYGSLPNYQRILAAGECDGPGDAAIVGDEARVTRELRALFAAGATDVWAAIFPVGDDRAGSRKRTRALLASLAGE